MESKLRSQVILAPLKHSDLEYMELLEDFSISPTQLDAEDCDNILLLCNSTEYSPTIDISTHKFEDENCGGFKEIIAVKKYSSKNYGKERVYRKQVPD